MSPETNHDYFLVDESDIAGENLQITGDEAHHLHKVFRKEVGDEIWAVDGNGNAYEAVIRNITEEAVSCDIRNIVHELNEPKIELTVGLGLLKASHLEETLNSCTQLGISSLIPLETSRSIKKSVNMNRLSSIAISAMKQSGRCRLPLLRDSIKFEDFISESDSYDLKILASMDKNVPSLSFLMNRINGSDINRAVLIVGPEGDFTGEEIDIAINAGFKAVSLGSRRLRSETASTAAVSIIMNHFEGVDKN